MRMRLVLGPVALGLAPLAADSQRVGVLALGDAAIHYEVAGAGPAVVLLHGWAHSARTWHFLFPELAKRYTVIRLDRRGFGQSTGAADVSQDPIDVRNLLDSLGIRAAVVIGHSQGANPALRFALAFPERVSGLVLYGSPAPTGFGLRWSGVDALPAGYSRIARERGLDSMWALFKGHALLNGFVDGTEGARIQAAMIAAYDGRDLLQPQAPSNATPAPNITQIGEIKVPTLVITGALEMPYFQIVADALGYGIPGAKRVRVPGGGHSVHLQQPQQFNSEISRFLLSVYR